MQSKREKNQFKFMETNQYLSKLTEFETSKLSKKYGSMVKKAMHILTDRIVADHSKRSSKKSLTETDLMWIQWHVLLELKESLTHLPLREIIAIFESPDLQIFQKRVRTIKFLADPYRPCYTLKELVKLTQLFRGHLERNRNSLIRIGFPETSFEKSKWFDHALNRLYFLKLPVSLQERRLPLDQDQAEKNGIAERDSQGNLVFSYAWIKKCPISIDLFYGKRWWQLDKQTGFLKPSGSLSFCEYKDASLIPGLSADLARKLEECRPQLFKLKIDIIDTLLRCRITSTSSCNILEECINTLLKSLKQEELNIYQTIDFILFDLEADNYLDQLFNKRMPGEIAGWGGLIDLYLFICHFAEETKIGLYDKTKSKIFDQLRSLGGLRSYYQVIGKSGQSDIDGMVDLFWSLLGDWRDYNEEFHQHLLDALNTEIKTKVSFFEYVKAKDAERFKCLGDAFLGWQARHLIETRKFASVEGSLKINEMTTVLSRKQEDDYKKHKYKCLDRVYIPGEIPLKRSNFLEINDHRIKLADSLFILFLRLVVELKYSKEGWAYIQNLFQEGVVSHPDKYQVFDRLRSKLEGSLLNKKNGQKFIEKGGSGRYRISTHPDFITYDRNNLLKHPQPQIRKLAEKLP